MIVIVIRVTNINTIIINIIIVIINVIIIISYY